MKEQPEAEQTPNEREKKKYRRIGVVTVLIIIALAAVVFALRARQAAQADEDYSTARRIIASIASGDRTVCKEALTRSLQAMRRQLGRSKVKNGLINHKAMIYHQVLESGQKICSEGSLDQELVKEAALPCDEAKACFNKAILLLLAGDLEIAQAQCKEGIALDNSPSLRELNKLIQKIENESVKQ